MARKPTTRLRHYVYDLIDPRTSEVFYVGRGVSGRANQHDCEPTCLPKEQRTKTIYKAGVRPELRIVRSFATADESSTFEELRRAQFRILLTPAIKKDFPKRIEQRRRPLDSWCGHPKYDKVCRFLPYYCVPSWRE